MTAGFLLVAVLLLAFANGANDNFKGVATLHGSGRLGYRLALSWATITTMGGSAAALFLGSHLVATFSGKGLVPPALVNDVGFVFAVAAGAGSTVLLATALGWPISTTHALIGGLCGAGIALAGSEVQFTRLGRVAVLPLLLSPLIACVGTFLLYRVFRHGRRLLGIEKESCVCVTPAQPIPASLAMIEPAVHGTANDRGKGIALSATMPPIAAHVSTCRARHSGTIASVNAQFALDSLHFLSTGAVSFARGLNDTPKIVALLTAAALLGMDHAVLLVGAAMAVGGALGARRVARRLSHEITPMNDGQGFSANLTTAALVIVASRFGVPVSTTHVSVGALFGIGAATGGGDRHAILGILSAWLLTLPLAGALAFVLATAWPHM